MRIPKEMLRHLYIKHNWFTGGTNNQYKKLFKRNEENATIEELATIIWVCTDDADYCDIHNKLDYLYRMCQSP